MVAIEIGFPPPEIEEEILVRESGVDRAVAATFVRLGQAVRRLDDEDLREVASPRALVSASVLVSRGLTPREAAVAAIVGPLTDDARTRAGLLSIVDAYLASE
jgi:nitric oxide reductase NorQ protein